MPDNDRQIVPAEFTQTKETLDFLAVLRTRNAEFFERRFWRRVATFWSRVRKTDGCWEWIGPFARGGYGHFGFFGEQFPHRIAWQLAHGKRVPVGKVLMHSCDNPPCVRPDHLTPGTVRENAIDCFKKGRSWVLTEDGKAHLRHISKLSLQARGEGSYKAAMLDPAYMGKIARRAIDFKVKGIRFYDDGPRRNNTSGFRGVHRHGKRWEAAIRVLGHRHYLGLFDDPQQASLAYQEKMRELFHSNRSVEEEKPR